MIDIGDVPLSIDVRRKDRVIKIAFNDHWQCELPFELLRVESPSAEVQGHVPSQKQTIEGKGNVGVVRLDPVGNYAIRIIFDDGHDTGIFSWRYLRELGEGKDEIWRAYLAALKAKGGRR